MSRHDLAYACFLAPGLMYLVGGIAHLIPMGTGTAGGIGLLVLVPLGLASLAAVPAGVYFSLPFRRDPVLMLIAGATILMLVQLFAELGPVKLRNLIGLVYGIGVTLGAGSWFLFRRKRMAAPGGS